jgi:hypothetical protein
VRSFLFAISSLLAVPDAAGQGPARAAATITEADVRRRINIIADDSMGGRDTPSPGLEATAQYIGREFRRMGLRPAGDSGGYFQRYGIRIRDTDPAGSSVAFVDPNGGQTSYRFGTDVKLMFGSPVEGTVSAELALGGGPIGPTDVLSETDLKGRILYWAADWTKGPAPFGPVLIAAANAGAKLVIISVNDDSAFAKLPGAQHGSVTAESVGWPAVLAIRERAVTAAIPEAEATLAQIRSATQVMTQGAEGWTVKLTLAFSRDERHAVPNVVAIVPGTDPALRGEYVAISAHFDHVGSRCRGADGPDKICNGADDNSSGTTGLLELAEAFAHPDAKPRRSILFVAVSGEERGLWGSEYFAKNPAVPIDQIVANINMDHLGRNWRDSIVVIGREHSDLGATVDRVAGEHRELNVGVLPDQWPKERIYFRSDHYNFAKEGVPILFFTNGFHDDYHAVTDSPDKIDAEKEARVVRLIWYTAREIANNPERPKWNPESEKAIVKRRRGAIP